MIPAGFAASTPYCKARPGAKDAGKIVSTAGDEPIPGVVTDVTDGDI
jgi:hypothetical protein